MSDEDEPVYFEVRTRPAAEDDIRGIRDRIARDIGPETADRYVAKTIRQLESLDLFPERGRDISREGMHLRAITSQDRKYTFFIRILQGDRVVEVLAVAGGGSTLDIARLTASPQE